MTATETKAFVEYIDNPGHWRAAIREVRAGMPIKEVLYTGKLKREAMDAAKASGLPVEVIR